MEIHRRHFFRAAAVAPWFSAIGGEAEAVTQDFDVSMEITRIYLAANTNLLLKNYSGARLAAERLYALSPYSSQWNTHSESFLLGCMLMDLTDPQEEDAYVRACLTVLDCYAVAFVYGDLSRNLKSIARAGYGAFGLDRSGRLIPAPRRSTVAMIALSFAGVAFGSERGTWAHAALAATRRFGGGNVEFGDATDRMMAAAVSVAGDWNEAITRYDSVLHKSSGAMESALRPSSNKLQGLAGVMAGATTVECEAATAYLLGGRTAEGMELLERSRRALLSHGSASDHNLLNAGAQLSSEVARGAIVVQIACTWIGTVALVRWSRKDSSRAKSKRGGDGKRRPANQSDGAVIVNLADNSYELFFNLVSSSAYFLSGRDGLVPTYSRIRKTGGKRADQAFQDYTDRAVNLAGVFVGNVIQGALAKAGATEKDDIIIVLQPSLALLPVALAQIAPNLRLIDNHRVRVVDSLYTAVKSASISEPATPTVAVISSSSAQGLRYLPFEIAAVASAFPKGDRVDPSADPRRALSQQDGTPYWHITGHGAWDFDHPEKSGLVMGKKGVVTVDDILGLSLTSPPRLVFLSACEAGQLNVHEHLDRYISIPTAFLRLGVKGVIAPLWAVSDVATSLLSARFYDLHMRERQSPSESLRRSQLWLKASTVSSLRSYLDQKVANGVGVQDAAALGSYLADLPGAATPFSHPYYWGGFQLFGS